MFLVLATAAIVSVLNETATAQLTYNQAFTLWSLSIGGFCAPYYGMPDNPLGCGSSIQSQAFIITGISPYAFNDSFIYNITVPSILGAIETSLYCFPAAPIDAGNNNNMLCDFTYEYSIMQLGKRMDYGGEEGGPYIWSGNYVYLYCSYLGKYCGISSGETVIHCDYDTPNRAATTFQIAYGY